MRFALPALVMLLGLALLVHLAPGMHFGVGSGCMARAVAAARTAAPAETAPAAPACPPPPACPSALGLQLPATPGYAPSLPDHELEKGVVSYGSRTRMRRFMHKLRRGQPIVAVFIGGSITAGGHGVKAGIDDHAALVFGWIQAAFPNPAHVLLNNAQGGALALSASEN